MKNFVKPLVRNAPAIGAALGSAAAVAGDTYLMFKHGMVPNTSGAAIAGAGFGGMIGYIIKSYCDDSKDLLTVHIPESRLLIGEISDRYFVALRQFSEETEHDRSRYDFRSTDTGITYRFKSMKDVARFGEILSSNGVPYATVSAEDFNRISEIGVRNNFGV